MSGRTWAVCAVAALASLALGCGSDAREATANEIPSQPERSVAPPGVGKVEGSGASRRGGILGEILGEPEPIREPDSGDFALTWLRAAYRDGDVATALDAVYWPHRRCRVGVFPCSELTTTARRVGAVVPLLPSANLRPTGMPGDDFDQIVEGSLSRLDPANLPEGEPELPYLPKRGEALFRFQDHHKMPRYLLLVRTGTTWKVVFLGNTESLVKLGA